MTTPQGPADRPAPALSSGLAGAYAPGRAPNVSLSPHTASLCCFLVWYKSPPQWGCPQARLCSASRPLLQAGHRPGLAGQLVLLGLLLAELSSVSKATPVTNHFRGEARPSAPGMSATITLPLSHTLSAPCPQGAQVMLMQSLPTPSSPWR